MPDANITAFQQLDMTSKIQEYEDEPKYEDNSQKKKMSVPTIVIIILVIIIILLIIVIVIVILFYRKSIVKYKKTIDELNNVLQPYDIKKDEKYIETEKIPIQKPKEIQMPVIEEHDDTCSSKTIDLINDKLSKDIDKPEVDLTNLQKEESIMDLSLNKGKKLEKIYNDIKEENEIKNQIIEKAKEAQNDITTDEKVKKFKVDIEDAIQEQMKNENQITNVVNNMISTIEQKHQKNIEYDPDKITTGLKI